MSQSRHGYQPMHAPRKEVSHERMAEILAKHKPKIEVRPAEHISTACVAAGAASAENTLPPLKWQKVNDWLMRTECGRYRCRKYIPGEVRIGEHNEVPKYQLEMLVSDLWFYRCGGPHDSFKAARAAAQKHLQQVHA